MQVDPVCNISDKDPIPCGFCSKCETDANIDHSMLQLEQAFDKTVQGRSSQNYPILGNWNILTYPTEARMRMRPNERQPFYLTCGPHLIKKCRVLTSFPDTRASLILYSPPPAKKILRPYYLPKTSTRQPTQTISIDMQVM